MITLTIDGREVNLEKSMTVLEAARSVGIKIPTLCWHPLLERYGGCRLCLVEVEKMPRMQTACTLLAADGMVVRTETEQIANVRRSILEFLLINHPLDCPYCDKAGECELQDLVEKYGPAKGRYHEKKRRVPEALEDPVIVRNMERCVMCTRCVRMCEGVQGASAISVINRGGHSHIEPFSGGKFDCEYCGNCVSVCPVGAIMSRLHRHSYRPWQVKENFETVCPYCGVGCTVVAQVRDDVIKRVVPKIGSAVNNGMLCSRGRFGYEFVGSEERIKAPLIRKQGSLQETTWEEAIGFVARRLAQVKEQSGPDAIAGIGSLRCTNEDNYVFQKFMRTVIGTNNIDTTARTGYAGAQAFIENIFGQGATANLISGLANSDTILVAGGDPTTINPILGLQIRACSRKDGRVLTIGRVKGLEYFNPLAVVPSVAAETGLLEGVVSALRAKKGLPGSNPKLEEKIAGITATPAEAAAGCGVLESEIVGFSDALAAAATPAIVIGREIYQGAGGSYRLLLLSVVAYLINARIYLLSERANEQGALDMGCAPDLLPGYRPSGSAEFRKRYETLWHTQLPEGPGLNLFGMLEAAKKGTVKAMYVMGENLLCNVPNTKAVGEALAKLELLVVQDIFLTETAKAADVVFPALGWGEKDGTFTNMERRIQRVRKSVSREGMEDWKIVAEVAGTMGARMAYAGSEDVFHEISRVSPLHRDLTYEDIDKGENIYPYKGEPLRDVKEEISVDKAAQAGAAGKLFLRIERPLFHSGTLSTRAASLVKICPHPAVKIDPATASRLSLKDGDVVRVTTSVGSLELAVAIDDAVAAGTVRISSNFEGRSAFAVTAFTVEPVIGAACIDLTEVRLEKVNT
ncbi:MAG: NADH-quinone oxidoreductase subunit NuoG [Thermodesulfovibrionales bacterium]